MTVMDSHENPLVANTTDPKAGAPHAGGLPDLELGALAPDFTLRDQFGQDVTLSSYRGTKAVAIFFFPFAFSGVCTGEMSGIRDRLDEFLTFDTEVLAISCDPVYSLRAFADADGLNFPLLSDFWPHGAVTRAYGVFDSTPGRPAAVVVHPRQGRDGALVGAQREPGRPRPGRASQGAQVPGLDPGLHLSANFPRGADSVWCSGTHLYLLRPLVTRDAGGRSSFIRTPPARLVCPRSGAYSSAVERFPYKEDVGGSIPSAPTPGRARPRARVAP